MDIKDAQLALDMEDAANEILGFFKDQPYMMTCRHRLWPIHSMPNTVWRVMNFHPK